MELNIKYIAAARIDDNKIILSYCHDISVRQEVTPNQARQDIERIAAELTESEWRQKFGSNFGNWHQISDTYNIAYFVLTRASYPERHAWSLLEELKNKLHQQGTSVLQTCPEEAYTKIFASEVIGLSKKYDDLRNLDKIQAVNSQVLEVQNLAQAGIQQVLRNTEKADEMAAKTYEMQQMAGAFARDATQLKRIMYWRNMRLKIIIAFVILAVILYITIPIAVTASD
jgi:vesicle-associated membrane protein 4